MVSRHPGPGGPVYAVEVKRRVPADAGAAAASPAPNA
jgi:hypothetical protein